MKSYEQVNHQTYMLNNYIGNSWISSSYRITKMQEKS
jgi:hypothetical protein